jgi:hydroxymethylglutaryl-CoA synthase
VLEWRAGGQRQANDESIAASFGALAAPGIEAVSHIGNTYTASLYFCLAGILEREARTLAGRRVGLFSYGSGCCAEFFTGTLPSGVESVADAGLRALLTSRTMIDMDEYERLMTSSELGGEPPQAFAGDFVFHGVRNDRREYGRLRESMAA